MKEGTAAAEANKPADPAEKVGHTIEGEATKEKV
jgi:hypothetical protein